MEIDKVLHSLAGIAVFFATAFVAVVLAVPLVVALLVSAVAVVTAGLLREAQNQRQYGGWDWADFRATINPFIFLKFITNGNTKQ